MTTSDARRGLIAILLIDAVTCGVMGVLLVLIAAPVAAITAVPATLLIYAGALLTPIALYMVVVARIGTGNTGAVWLVIMGNVGWVAASLGLFAFISPNAIGVIFILAQALVVAVLAWLEYAAWRTNTMQCPSAA